MNKGNGRHPQGMRWVMKSGYLRPSYWVTKDYYTYEEVRAWECSNVQQPLYPLDIEL